MEPSQEKMERTPLEIFREEMRVLKSGEMKKKKEWETRGRRGEAYDPHFDDISPEFLTEEDRIIWSKIKNQTLTRPELEAYRRQLDEELKTASAEVKKSRLAFQALAANKAIFISQKEAEVGEGK